MTSRCWLSLSCPAWEHPGDRETNEVPYLPITTPSPLIRTAFGSKHPLPLHPLDVFPYLFFFTVSYLLFITIIILVLGSCVLSLFNHPLKSHLRVCFVFLLVLFRSHLLFLYPSILFPFFSHSWVLFPLSV